MIGISMAIVWFAVVSLALACCALVERRARVTDRGDRPELAPLRRVWGGGLDRPPATSLLARLIAGGARLVRSRTVVSDRAIGLRGPARIVSCVALGSALSIIPFGGPWGGQPDAVPLVVVDLNHGLAALVFFMLLSGMAEVGVGLSDRSVWSRLGSVRIATQMLGGIGLFAVVLAPLALETGSLRLFDIASIQQSTFAPLAWLVSSLPAEWAERASAWRWPAWHLFDQPLTALLFIPATGFLTRRPLAEDVVSGGVATSGFGFDADPAEVYWERTEARLAMVLFASLFVSLFLGAGSIPYFDPAPLVTRGADLVGLALPSLLLAIVETAVFFLKLMLVLALLVRVRRVTARLRDDQWLRIITRRLLPLAWANLLLMSAITLLSDSIGGSA